INMIIKYNVPICSFTFGIPDALTIEKLKEHQVILIGTATTVEEAIENEKAGIDIVVAQGSEAGGHRGSFLQISHNVEPMVGTMSLVPQVVDHVSIPVVAAGGIMDERGLLASLMLGAQGVQMGTAFLTSHESGANELLKDTILKSKETDTVVTNVFSGKNARGINNQFVKEMSEYQGVIPDYPIQNQLTTQIRKAAVQQGDSELTHIWSGQSPRLAEKQNAANLIERMVSRISDMSNL
ncbi:nitronate monooxygenase family protein, partial [Pseudomonas aeruginosa]|nr:nitronate monooxygenase family protein [Pseudomonas aeruginosa]